MKELFRFVSIRKFNHLVETPCGKIKIDDVVKKPYSDAIISTNKKDIAKIMNDFFKSADFNKDPLTLSLPIANIYSKIGTLKGDELLALCQNECHKDVNTIVNEPRFLVVKSIIVENLYFLMKANKQEFLKLKILYKHLLKIIGLLEAISQYKPECLEKISKNPSLLYFQFKQKPKIEKALPKKENNEGEDKELLKEKILKKYDEIVDLKEAQKEIISIHKSSKVEYFKNQKIIIEGVAKSKKNIPSLFNLFGLFGTTSNVVDDNLQAETSLTIRNSDIDDKTKKSLENIGLNLINLDPYDSINTLEIEIINRTMNLRRILDAPKYFTYDGKHYPVKSRKSNQRFNFNIEERESFAQNLNYAQSTESIVPHSTGKARILGEGLVYRVEEEFKGLKTANLGSVLNIPAHSEKTHKNRNLTKVVTTTESESEINNFEETTSESREQNNMSYEVSKVQTFDMNLQAGVNFSASYGPTIEVEASTDFSLGISNSETTNSASSYAKDITQRAVKRIEKKVRELLKTERTLENEVKDLEGYKNKTDKHSVGIYQWINEVYESKLIHYDSRLLLEFMVPEPGNMLLYAGKNPNSSVDNPMPVEPSIFNVVLYDPNEFQEILDETNYKKFISLWTALDISPPPLKNIVISKTVSSPPRTDTSDDAQHIMVNDETLVIPEGYNIDYVRAKISTTRRMETDEDIDPYMQFLVTIGWAEEDGGFIGNMSRQKVFKIPFNENRHWNNIPISVVGYQARAFILNISAYLIRQDEALDKWKIETYGKLKQAYQRQLDEYNDKLTLYNQKVYFSGNNNNRNPDKNRNIEKDELKRACISILTNQSFELFDSIDDDGDDFPKINFDQVHEEGNYVRFFENAFEWTQLIHILYPYFWADPNSWIRSINLNLDDAKHEEFLKSGFARVVVPVRPDFQAAILKYLEEGLLWDGNDPDSIDIESSLYLPIWREIMERQGQLQENPIIERTWLYEVPTNHQIISPETALPHPLFI